MNIPIQPIPCTTRACIRPSACGMTRAILAAMLLLGLAMAGTAAAGQSDDALQEEDTFETDGEAFIHGENDFVDIAEANDETSFDDTAGEEQSEGKRLKKGLKRIIVDSLLTATQRKAHDTLGISKGTGAGQEPDPEP